MNLELASIISKKNQKIVNKQYMSTTEKPMISDLNEQNEVKKESEINIKDKLIISNIENIFSNLNKEVVPFRRIRFQMVLVLFINFTIFWMFTDIIIETKNNFYCYNRSSKTFEICDKDLACMIMKNLGINKFYFLSPSVGLNIWNYTTIYEVNMVNDLLLDHVIKDEYIYLHYNEDRINKSNPLADYFNVGVQISKNEGMNINIAFNQMCNRLENNLIFGFFLLIGAIFGNIIYGIFADIFGRNKILSILLIIQFLCCTGVAFITLLIQASGDLTQKWVPDSMYKTEYITYNKTNIWDPINLLLFNFSISDKNLDYQYIINFPNITNSYYSGRVIQINFQNLRIFLIIFYFILAMGVGASKNISLAMIVETSANDVVIYYSYFIFYCGIVFSLLFKTLLGLIDSFSIPYIIMSGLFLYSFILITFFSYESPRYYYEYSEYDKLTNSILKSVKSKYLTSLFVSKNNPKAKYEIDRMNKLNNESTFKFFSLGFLDKFRKIRKDIIKKNTSEIKKSDLLLNPLIFLLLIYYDKNFRSKYLIIFSHIAITSLTFFSVISNFYSLLVVNRNDLYNNYIVNKAIFFLCLCLLFSNFFNYFLLKFFGINLILTICYSMTFIFSIIFMVNFKGINEPEDLDVNYYDDYNILENSRSGLITTLCIVAFFANGSLFSLFFFLIKYTKTMYRCFFLGICSSILYCMIIISLGISQYFDNNLNFVIISSVMGFVISLFIDGDMGFNIVNDFRKIQYEA